MRAVASVALFALLGTVGSSTLGARHALAQASAAMPEPRAALPADEQLVDEVVAALELPGETRPPAYVLRSELLLIFRFEMASSRAPAASASDPATVTAMVELGLGERALEREADQAGEPEPPPADVLQERTRLNEILARVGGPLAFTRAAGHPPEALDALVRRRVRLSRYLLRQYARLVEPSETEIRTAYGEERFGSFRASNVPFAVARPEIREALLREGYARAVRAYLRALGARARLRWWAPTATTSGLAPAGKPTPARAASGVADRW